MKGKGRMAERSQSDTNSLSEAKWTWVAADCRCTKLHVSSMKRAHAIHKGPCEKVVGPIMLGLVLQIIAGKLQTHTRTHTHTHTHTHA